MSLPLLHSQAEIIAKVLISLGLGNVTTSSIWPIFSTNEPNVPDNCITVYDTAGLSDGRIMHGEATYHAGFMVRVRSKDHPTGWVKVEQIRQALAESVYDRTVLIGVTTYMVQSITRFGQSIPLGKDPDSKCSVFSLNATCVIQRVEPGTGT